MPCYAIHSFVALYHGRVVDDQIVAMSCYYDDRDAHDVDYVNDGWIHR
jgi:hypothetical protein